MHDILMLWLLHPHPPPYKQGQNSMPAPPPLPPCPMSPPAAPQPPHNQPPTHARMSALQCRHLHPCPWLLQLEACLEAPSNTHQVPQGDEGPQSESSTLFHSGARACPFPDSTTNISNPASCSTFPKTRAAAQVKFYIDKKYFASSSIRSFSQSKALHWQNIFYILVCQELQPSSAATKTSEGKADASIARYSTGG